LVNVEAVVGEDKRSTLAGDRVGRAVREEVRKVAVFADRLELQLDHDSAPGP
jgi:hypothetical protein